MMDRYKKITMIGKGTFGSAWLVVSKLSGYRYAIKELSVRTMSASDRHLALNEVKILSTLKHRNIVRYKNAFEEESNFYIVMEYAEGGEIGRLNVY
jgi:NIMA (never in mitosis gene a)-related kinase